MQKIYDILIPVSAIGFIFLSVFIIFLSMPHERTALVYLSGFCLIVCGVSIMLSNEQQRGV
jgi:hypothetical protein